MKTIESKGRPESAFPTFALPTRFGRFGGCFAPETLMPSLLDLEQGFREIVPSVSYRDELLELGAHFAGRPTPLTFAANTSRLLGLELYLKREDLLHTGAHKLNHCLGQVLLARHMGKQRVFAETGAGQHGVATATACARLGLACTVFMGARDAERQAPNVARMRLLGARVVEVETGARTLKDAVDAALRAWCEDPQAAYCLGSALGPHPYPSLVAHFQAVVGVEARRQFDAQAGGLPDAAIACVGGGSNAIGLFRGFLDDPVELIGVEAGGLGAQPGRHAARFDGGSDGVLHGCFTRVLQDADGQALGTHSISAGMDYPAIGPEHAHLVEIGRARFVRAEDKEVLRAFEHCARAEGILPALESSHALAWILGSSAELRGKRVVMNLSGRGDKDLASVQRALGEPRP